MKKTLIVTLALAFVLAIGQTAFAAPSAFSDVPAKHWAYGALSKLTRDGVLQGYPDGTFRGDRVMSRYEMAIVVARAVTKADKANAEDRELIQKLEGEFHSELDSLNARVDSLEKKVDVLTYHGDVRVRMDKAYFEHQTVTPANHINLDVFWGYQVNDRWMIKGESEYNKQMANNQFYGNLSPASGGGVQAGTDNGGTSAVAEQLYATGPVGGATVKVGRYSAYSPAGLVYDDKVSGAEVAFGKVVNVKLQGGQASSGPAGDGFANGQNYAAALFAAPIGKNSNIQAGFLRIGANVPNSNQKTGDWINYYTVGYDTKLGADWGFNAAYAKSNADNQGDSTQSTTAWLAKIQYKAADLNVPGTYDIYAEYRKSPGLAQYSNTDDWILDTKGTRIGFDYTLDKNITFLSWYTFGKFVSDVRTGHAGDKANMFRTQLDFHF